MTLKTKLITSVSMFFMVVALLVVGVWAVSSAQVTMGGTISFNATNIYATITGTIEGATNAKAITPLEYSAKTEPNDTAKATWCQDLTFADATIPTIKWTITIENKSERALYVTLKDNITSLSNATKTLTFAGSTYTIGEKEIPAKTSKIFTMEIKVSDTNASATVDYDFAFDLRDENSDQAPSQGTSSVELYRDETDTYWYVKMGHTDTISEIRWRLVGLDGERYTSKEKPTSGKGTFILETPYISTTNSKFNASASDGNDYATSLIRTYLKGDYVTALNLANDATYQAIDPRSVSELYENMAWRIDNANQVENCSLPTGTYDTTEDSLWLMSVAEIYELVGGGTITDSKIIDTNWKAYYDNLIWNEEYYWLRSPGPGYDNGAFFVYDVGACYSGRVGNNYAVRPAFNLNF